MKKVLVLGGSGMLGSMVVDYLAAQGGLQLASTTRSPDLLVRFRQLYPNVSWVDFDCHASNRETEVQNLGSYNWIINAIGITKPLIKDDNPQQVENAVLINCLLPHDLGRHAEATGCRVIQIATDCVYSGVTGAYNESALHDALDVYGKSKSIGETWQPLVHHLRCSIIGPEPKDFKFLIEWFRRQTRSASVNGFTNHNWNGVTTLQFAKLCQGIINSEMDLPHLQHVVPAGNRSKAEMLQDFARAYKRQDISISNVEAKVVIDRTLSTSYPERNAKLWEAAGYTTIPSVADMIDELGSYDYRGAGNLAESKAH